MQFAALIAFSFDGYAVKAFFQAKPNVQSLTSTVVYRIERIVFMHGIPTQSAKK